MVMKSDREYQHDFVQNVKIWHQNLTRDNPISKVIEAQCKEEFESILNRGLVRIEVSKLEVTQKDLERAFVAAKLDVIKEVGHLLYGPNNSFTKIANQFKPGYDFNPSPKTVLILVSGEDS